MVVVNQRAMIKFQEKMDMIKSIVIILVISVSVSADIRGQFFISTNSTEIFSKVERSEEWKFESLDEDDVTFFMFSEEFDFVEHTTADGTSAYLITSEERDLEGGRDQFLFTVTSDVGNEYVMIWDIANENIRFVSSDRLFLVRYTIKSSWQD